MQVAWAGNKTHQRTIYNPSNSNIQHSSYVYPINLHNLSLSLIVEYFMISLEISLNKHV